jgi:glycolate oxidase FAD binding subunit
MTYSAPASLIAPRDSQDVCDAVREAASARRSLRIIGGGGWLDAGRPVAGATPLDLSALSGVVEYVPGDLTLTARAATPLAELAHLTKANGQWLPLDPFEDGRATLGATLATASTEVRGGGRVVKNVAGFDLVRLNVGAWGTLGVITEATVRLRALPAYDATLALPAAPSLYKLEAQLAALRTALLTPLAMELLNGELATRLGMEGCATILVRLAGNDESVKAQQQVLASLGDAIVVDGGVWERLRSIEAPGSLSFRLSRRPSMLQEIWLQTVAVLSSLPDTLMHATVERGVVRVVLPVTDNEALAAMLAELSLAGSLICERLPLDCWQSMPTEFSNALAQSARRAFDPMSVLNPGIVAPLL